MTSGHDDLVEIASNGAIEPRGQAALLRLQAKAGRYHVLPSPEEVLLLERAGAGDTRTCSLCGRVRSAGRLCDVLSFVGQTGWRGELVVHGDSSTRSIFFDGGHVTGAQSSVVKERLGEVLYRFGVLTREQVNQCGEATAEGKLRFGEVAVKKGMLAREQLFGLMARQIEEIFYGLLLVEEGAYFFLEGYDEERLASRHSLSLTALLRDGIRRMHEMRYFRARIPSEDHVAVRIPDRAPPENDLHGVFAALDGQRTVADVCRITGAGEFEVTRALFHFVQTGHVAIQRPRLTASAMVDVYNAAIALLLRELDAMDEGEPVRAQLASFAMKPPYAQLFAGAGPSDDGTLSPERLQQNLRASAASEEHLAAWLHDYASYALFIARPHLRRHRDSLVQLDEDRPRLSVRVSAMLEALSPSTDRVPRTEPPKEWR